MQNSADDFRQAAIDAKGFFPSLFDFNFTSFIATKVIKILYMLVMVVIALEWLGWTIFGFEINAIVGLLFLVIVGPIFALLALIFYRIMLELIMVIFRIADNISHMTAMMRTTAVAGGQDVPPAPPSQQLYPS